MIELTIPGRGVLHLQHLVSDVNGTLAVDGILLEGVANRIAAIRELLTVHLLTADTHGTQNLIDQQLDLKATKLNNGNEQEQKRLYVEKLDPKTVVTIGQGLNDAGMLECAALGICILSPEGVAVKSLLAADLLVPNIMAAFDLLDRPRRIVASLRT